MAVGIVEVRCGRCGDRWPSRRPTLVGRVTVVAGEVWVTQVVRRGRRQVGGLPRSGSADVPVERSTSGSAVTLRCRGCGAAPRVTVEALREAAGRTRGRPVYVTASGALATF